MKAQKISILLISLGLLAGCSRRSEHTSGVELVLSTSELSPGTTFELRFERPIKRSASSGSRSNDSPVVFSPSLSGTFAGTSSRGGIFTRGEPMKLGTEYELSLAPALFEL